MGPRKNLKTYSSTSINSSVDAFNLLFAKNLTKRIICKKKTGRKKFKIRELPAHRDQTVFKDDSLQVSTEDTFDKLRKGCLNGSHKLDNASTSESTTSYVPFSLTRTNHSDNSHSPKITRSRKRLSASLKNKSDSILHRFNDPTNETINSIEIEVETNKNMDSLSYIRIPQVKSDNNKLSTKYPSIVHSTDDCSKMDDSFTNIFSKTFLEKQHIMSSTPLASLKRNKESKLLLKSFEKIKSWEHVFPTDESNSSNGKMNKSETNAFINLRTRKIYKSLSYDTKNSYNLTFSSNRGVKKTCSEPNSECCITHNNQSTYEQNTCGVITENNHFSKIKSNDIIHSFKNLEYSSDIQYNHRIDSKRRYKVSNKGLEDSKSQENLSLNMSHSAGNKISNAPVCLRVNRPKPLSLEDFEKFYNHYISKIHHDDSDNRNQYIQSKISPKEIIINLSKNIDVFEKFYQDHYSKIDDDNQTSSDKTDTPTYKDLVVNITKHNQTVSNDEKQTASNKIDTTFPYKDTFNITKDCHIVPSRNEIVSQCNDIVVNITRQDDMFEKFYSNIATEINGREKPETDIENIVTELVVNVSKCNFDNYGNYLDKIQEEKQSLEPDSTLKSRDTTLEQKSLDLFENCNTLLSGSDILKSLDKCSDKQVALKDTKNVDKKFESEDTSVQCSLEDSLYKYSTISTKKRIPSVTKKIVSNSKSKIKLMEIIDLTDSVNESIQASNPSLGRFTISTSDIIEGSLLEANQIVQDGFKMPLQPKKLMLKPGKLWRRSLLMHRRSTLLTDTNVEEKCFLNNGQNCKCKSCNCTSLKLLRRSSIIVLNSDKSATSKDFDTTLLEEYAENCGGYAPTKICAENLENNLRSLSLIEENSHILDVPPPVTAKEIVLRKCGQVDPIPFQECYPESLLQNCHKIGEGVYGEVFLLKNPSGGTSVIKIIPIEGSLIVNGEKQKKFDEILSEIIIALELSNLRYNKSNSTYAFNEVQQIKCVQGNYPPRLLDLWDLFDEVQGSENDCPEIFPSNQLFIVLQLANGGKDLESFVFNNAMQAYAMFEQVAVALAVAETELGFEHRDLHWGNVLLKTVDKDKTITYRLDEQDYEIFTRGVEVAIIDFTLSRIEYNGVVMFNDLSIDEELFNGDGDYQFDIYRLMKEKNRNKWQNFEPYTNILWLHYVLEKAVSALRYKYTRSKIHKEYTAKLKLFYNEILSYKSVKDFVFSYILTK